MTIRIETTVSGTIHLTDVPQSMFEQISEYVNGLLGEFQNGDREKVEVSFSRGTEEEKGRIKEANESVAPISSKPSISDVNGVTYKGTLEYDQMRKIFGRRFEARRVELGLNRQDVSRIVGAGPGVIHEWAHGINFPSPKYRGKIAKLFGEDIFEGLGKVG